LERIAGVAIDIKDPIDPSQAVFIQHPSDNVHLVDHLAVGMVSDERGLSMYSRAEAASFRVLRMKAPA
jgi:hypothetical protein